MARDRVLQYASTHPKFAAIDRAIGRDGLRVVFLLRLSPLLPLAASNYLYGGYLRWVLRCPQRCRSWVAAQAGNPHPQLHAPHAASLRCRPDERGPGQLCAGVVAGHAARHRRLRGRG